MICCSLNRRGMLGDIEVDDTVTIALQDDEDIEDSQTNRCDCKEVNGIPAGRNDCVERSSRFE